MKIYVDLDHVDITEYTQIESGEYNTNKINFIFTPEYKDLVKVAIFGCKLDTDEPKFYKIYLSDDSCYLPSEVTAASDVISIGVYAFNVENGELKLRYSPTPVKTIVYEGSFREEAENSSSPTPTEIEQIMSRIISLEEITSDLNTRVEALENKACDLDSIKEDVAELKDDVENISGRVDTIESDIDDLEGDLANTYSKTEVDTLLGNKVDTSTFTESQNAQDEKIAKAELILSQLPKVTGEGTNISLSPTIEYDLEVDSYKGDIKQATSILPSEYQQVEYIASDGTQRINTEVTGEANWSIKACTNYNPNKIQIMLGRSYSQGYYFGANAKDKFTLGGGIDFTKNSTDVTEISMVCTNSDIKVTIGNETQTRTITSQDSINAPYSLFSNPLQPQNFNAYMNLYYAKCYQNNTLVRDFIPCYRIADNVIGLYDLVNNVFYTNSGTGSFTKGSNVSIPNPNYPQDIQVVTGTQTVTISNADNTESQTYTLHLGDLELAKIHNTNYLDTLKFTNNKWYKGKKVEKIVSYNGETISTDYISTTGQLTTGAKVYYGIQEQDVEITDTTLLSDLNNIKENAMSYSGTTNISSSGNLPIIISASALKQLS